MSEKNRHKITLGLKSGGGGVRDGLTNINRLVLIPGKISGSGNTSTYTGSK